MGFSSPQVRCGNSRSLPMSTLSWQAGVGGGGCVLLVRSEMSAPKGSTKKREIHAAISPFLSCDNCSLHRLKSSRMPSSCHTAPCALELNGIGVLIGRCLFFLLVLGCTQKVEAIDVAVCGPDCLALVVLVAGVPQLAPDADQVTLLPV
jgi:hypothetical protein